MKLIPLIILTINLAGESKTHEHFTFPPQFQTPHPGMFTSEKNPYLPPESHTPIPYFPMHNINKMPFPYLPATAGKPPVGYPSPFPILLSSTIRSHKNNDDDDDDEEENTPTPMPQYMKNKLNRTEKVTNQRAERREMRPIPKMFHPIDRIDTKMPYQFNTSPEPSTQSSVMQSMAPRSIIISDIQRERDQNMDHIKAAASFPGAQYVPQPGVFISTTETAIPILRLSNEMDLDGSFSYEALGADQTHYVQHSRMENAGTGKDEQVVEGSYSYVGDNGKTYTVHYIADANGFRASGDHLPVAPPVPEIIQRAVQYNLAEEAKKPPHMKSWSGEEKENEIQSESEKRYQFALSPPRLSSLFTGKTPESFSHSFSQASNTQNNLVAAASSQNSVQTAIDFADQLQQQTKQSTGTISPQITFVASQGAHVPSANPQQQTIGRAFTTEKSTMPQLVNYEANMKDSEQENNKALWRWQYGINANANHHMEKNSISRSFGADDIIINFNDMSPEQYTKMIKQQLEPNMGANIDVPQQVENPYSTERNYYHDYTSNLGQNYEKNNNLLKSESSYENQDYQYSTQMVTTLPNTESELKYQYESNKNYLQSPNENSRQVENSQTSRPKLITHHQFTPQSQTITQSYNYDENNFESRRTKILNSDSSALYDMNLHVLPMNYEKHIQYNTKPSNEMKTEHKVTTTTEPSTTTTTTTVATTTKKLLDIPTNSNFRFADFIVPDDSAKNDFKPLFKFTEPPTTTTTTTEASIENAFEENIFLKNLFRNNKNEQEIGNKIRDEEKHLQVKPIDTRNDKSPKFIQYQSKPYNEIKVAKKKPVDLAELLNYITRNQFESSKVKSKQPKQVPVNNYKQKNEMHYYNMPEDDEEATEERNNRNYRTLQQQEELRGVIKNYKVLNRNNNYANAEQNDYDGLRRDLSPPPMKAVNLPPLGRAGPSMKSYLPPIYV